MSIKIFTLFVFFIAGIIIFSQYKITKNEVNSQIFNFLGDGSEYGLQKYSDEKNTCYIYLGGSTGNAISCVKN
jgi:hypothetical protein